MVRDMGIGSGRFIQRSLIIKEKRNLNNVYSTYKTRQSPMVDHHKSVCLHWTSGLRHVTSMTLRQHSKHLKLKPHRGTIYHWKEYFPDVANPLGFRYVVQGYTMKHPHLGMELRDGWIQTSWVLKAIDDGKGTVEIETLNSRYILKDKDTDWVEHMIHDSVKGG